MIQKNTKFIKINFIFKFNKKKIYIYIINAHKKHYQKN